MLLGLAERRRRIAETFAGHIPDARDPNHVTHTVADVLRARMLAIGCGYPDGNDFDWLRSDPAFNLACGRLPDTGKDLCSQPTHLALGERADAQGARHLVQQLQEAAKGCDARYR